MKREYNKHMKHHAFTLVETLVSVAIILILSGVTIANYGQIRTESQLTSDLEKAVGAIRVAQVESLAPERARFGIIATDQLCSVGVVFNSSSNTIQPYFRSISQFALAGCDDGGVLAQPYGEAITLTYGDIIGPNSAVYFDVPFGGISEASTLADPIDIQLRSNQDAALIRSILVFPSGIIETQ